MKKTALLFAFVTLLFTFSVSAQDEPEQLPLEKLLEADANHNLIVAWQYYTTRKAYLAVLMRTEETMAAHPSFSKMDEILYLSGMGSYYLSEGKGKQKIDLNAFPEEEREKYKPARLRSDAIAYFGLLVEQFPESKYFSKAKDMLKKLDPDN